MSPWGIGLDFATILSTSIECILYGISVVMFGGAVWALTRGRPKDEISWSMVLVAMMLMILSTIHLTVDVHRLVNGFITQADIFPGGPTGFFADVTQRTFIIKITVYVLQTLLGDVVAIYRCYVVWKRVRVIVLPVVLCCAASATSVGFLYQISHTMDPNDVFLINVGRWVVPFYVLTMSTNVSSSVLLAYRIWATNQDVPGVVRVLSRSVIETKLLLRILVDAALLYTLTHVALLACFAYQTTGQFIVLDMMTPIISITFYTVLVRIAIARNDSNRIFTPTLSPLRFAARAVLPTPPERTFTGARRSSI